MKIFALFVLALAAVATQASASVLTEEEVESLFEQFKNDFSRSYNTQSEELQRKTIFRSNLEFIVRHNVEASSGKHTFTVGINDFTDLTNGEFQRKISQLSVPNMIPAGTHRNASIASLPAEVDWVAKGAVSPVINQGQCGSSWAIPAVDAIEGAHAIKTGSLVTLSVQQMIDCCAQDGNYGCNGGFIEDGYKCIIRMHGIDTAASYPYNGDGNEQCKFNAKTIGATISSYRDLAHNEAVLQNAIATVGPVAAGIDASQQSFQFYQSGVYYEPACSQSPDHGVTVVGYGTLPLAYWKVKNSWGPNWGESGYIRMARNRDNMCGIANMASYPIV